jgi:hypothetical protein
MVEDLKLIKRLRDAADADEVAAEELDPMHYTADDPEDIIAGLEFRARERRECADMIEQQAARLTALESERDALLAAAGKEAVAWQVRRADGRIDGVPIQWENCTKELYDATLATGRYAGFERGPKCEVRALYDAPTPAVDTRVKPVAWTLADELARRESTCKAHLWFSDPVNTAWIPLYTAPTAALEPVPAASFVLRALVAAGHVSQAKVDEAIAIARKTPGVDAAALENGDGRDAWQPIDTAPKFGEPIDVWGRYGRKSECVFGRPTYAGGLHWIYEAGYDSNGPVFEIVVDPTHWMPPPASPSAANDKEKQS